MTFDPTAGAARPVPLNTLPDGATARLVAVHGGLGLRSRLMAMGLRPGARLRVVHNRGRGPFVVASGEARIVLGRGMAGHVLVVPDGADETDNRAPDGGDG